MSSLRRLSALARVAARDPRELKDRLRGQIELRLERGPQTQVPVSDEPWSSGLHRLLATSADACTACEGFTDLWQSFEDEVRETRHQPGRGFDAGKGLALAAYAATIHLAPDVVVETGVARGVTSRFVLEALRATSDGVLYSIDLPPHTPGWEDEWAVAVPPDLRRRWHFVRGASRRHLPSLVSRVAPIGVFIHDSLHTTRTVLFELRTVWPHLTPGGMALVDDVDDNSGFMRFVDQLGGDAEWLVVKEQERSGMVGAIRHP